MKKRLAPLEYPVVIKQHLDFVVLSVPDLGITVVENTPRDGKLTPKYILKIATALAKVWLKTQTSLTHHRSAGKTPPKASKQKMAVDGKFNQSMTSSEIAKRLGVTRMTVHRLAKSGILKSTQTKGGHRRFSELDLKEYENRLLKTL